MKKIILCLFFLIVFKGFSQDLNNIKIAILNKKKFISDSVFFSVNNKTPDTLKIYFSLQVKNIKNWQEIYSDIYNTDRDVLKKIIILPRSTKFFSYPIKMIHSLYKERIGTDALRIAMVGFYKNFNKGIYKKYTTEFYIKPPVVGSVQ